MPTPRGPRSIVTQSSVSCSQPSGTWRVNQPRGSVRTGIGPPALLLYDFPRPGARGLAAAHDDGARDDHVANPRGELERILEAGAIGHAGGVEDDEVGPLPRFHLADALEAERRSGLRRHLAH